MSDYLAQAVETVLQIHAHQPPGDVLLFLTGQQEVDAAVTLLRERAHDSASHSAARKEQQQQQQQQQQKGGGGHGGGHGGAQLKHTELLYGLGGLTLHVLPLYSGLGSEQQLRAFEPPPHPNCRKVIVATNIAETSVTIDGIVYVVDCGFTKLRVANPSGEEALVVAPESQASARQRAGRAGRSRPGEYYCLMPELAFDALEPQTPPEMQRCALASTVLQLKALGIDNVARFDFLSPPPPQALANALEQLYALGALDGAGGDVTSDDL